MFSRAALRPAPAPARARAAAAHLARTLHADTKNSSVATEEVKLEATAPEVLVDSFGRRHNYLRISLTEKCNLRCTYCMPAGGVALSPRAALLTGPELVQLVRVFAALGVDKLRLTGGEPTLRPDLPELVRELKAVPGIKTVGLTSNGLALARRLPALQRAGLDALNLSLDSLRPERFERLARRPGLPRVLACMDLALQLGYSPLKINTVLMQGVNDDELFDFVELTRERDVEVRFIEFMPFTGNKWARGGLVPARAVLRRLAARYDLAPAPPRPNDTATVAGVGGGRARGPRGVHLVHDAALLRRLQPAAAHGRREPQGVPVRGGGGVAAGRAAGRRGRGGGRAGARRARQEASPARRYGKSSANEKPTYDINRRVASMVSGGSGGAGVGWVPRRACSSLSHVDQEGRVGWVPRRACSSLSHVDQEGRVGWVPRRACSSLSHVDQEGRVGWVPRRACSSLSHVDQEGRVGWVPRRACSSLSHVDQEGRVGWVPRRACSSLSHVDQEGRARMVDVGGKHDTRREAVAVCQLRLGGTALRLLRDHALAKGDALTVAELAGVMAAKRTADLIPLCHQLPLDAVRVRLRLPEGPGAGAGAVRVECRVRCQARSGAEMEALVGAALAALALYDMCKAADPHMRLTDLHVTRKTGGKADFSLEDEKPPAPAPPAPAPAESYTPSSYMH